MRAAQPTRDKLAEAVAKYNLTDETEAFLREVCQPAEWRQPGLSMRAKRKELDDVATMAKALTEKLDALSASSSLRLDDELTVLNAPSSDPMILGGRIVFVQEALQTIALAAGQVTAAGEDDGARGGRPTSQKVPLVAIIAVHLKSYSIKPSVSEGGPFMSICAACFELAQIAAGPEGAVRTFNSKWRADYKARGHCL